MHDMRREGLADHRDARCFQGGANAVGDISGCGQAVRGGGAMNRPHIDWTLSGLELQVMLRFRRGMNTAEIAEALMLSGGEPEAVRLLASARRKTKAKAKA